jgi:transposase
VLPDEPSRQRLRADVRELRGAVERLERRLAERDRQLAERDHRIAELETLLAAALRRGKRQAAPFSRGGAKQTPGRPGRRAGGLYGKQAVRGKSEKVDEKIVVQCLLQCPRCDGEVRLTGEAATQQQVDIPKSSFKITQFEIQLGVCTRCGFRVQGRHPKQTSDAVGVGSVQIGPRVLATTAELNKVGGLSYGKIATFFSRMFDLKVNRSTLARGLERLAVKAEPTRDAIAERIRASPELYPDETGWRINAQPAWLWTATNKRQTLYEILRGRGYEQACKLIGADYSGIIGSDGWIAYRLFAHAKRQACMSHLLRRCEELLTVLHGSSRELASEVRGVLRDALLLRDLLAEGHFDRADVAVERHVLEASLDDLLRRRFRHPENRRFAKHLTNLRDDLFRFLDHPGLEATNWPAEQAIRPAVVNRKMSGGGNRTDTGAHTQSVLMTLLRTGHQIGLSVADALVEILQSPKPMVVANFVR